MKLKLLGLLLILGAVALTGYMYQQRTTQEIQDIPPVMTGSDIGGPFTLVNHNGEEVTQETYAGKYLLMFFGFVNCPAICPTELDKIAAAMDQMPQDIRDQVQPLFITTDPERDTAEVVKEYVTKFHPSIVGLTGTQEQIKEVSNAWRVYAEKVEMDGFCSLPGVRS